MTVSDDEVLERFPDAYIDHDNKHFYKGLLDKKLIMNRCDSCGTWHTPPASRCPRCWSPQVTPTPVSGEGTLHLLIFLHQGPPAEGVDYATPYPVATVELEEQKGLRFNSTIINCAKDAMTIGMPLRLTWTERAGVPFPVFEPAS